MTSDDYAWTERWAQENLEGDERDLFLRCLSFEKKVESKKGIDGMLMLLLLSPVVWIMGTMAWSDLFSPLGIALGVAILVVCCCIDGFLDHWIIQRIDDAPDVDELNGYAALRVESDAALKLAKEAEGKRGGKSRSEREERKQDAPAEAIQIASTHVGISENPKKMNKNNPSICPKCGSRDTVVMGSTKRVSVSRAVVGGALLGPVGAGVGAVTGKKIRSEFLCRSCGARWRV